MFQPEHQGEGKAAGISGRRRPRPRPLALLGACGLLAAGCARAGLGLLGARVAAFAGAPRLPRSFRLPTPLRAQGADGAAATAAVLDSPEVRATAVPAPLFPKRRVDASTDDTALARELALKFRGRPGTIVDLEFRAEDGPEAVVKVMYTLARMAPWARVVAQLLPRRGDLLDRVRVVNELAIEDFGAPEVVVVREAADEELLAENMREMLLDDDTDAFREVSLQLDVRGDGGAVRAMKALQFLYFSTRREVAFVPRFQANEEGDFELSISVMLARRQDLFAKDTAERLALVPPVDWLPDTHPYLFHSLAARGDTNSVELAKNIAVPLHAHTSRLVEVSLAEPRAAHKVVMALATLPEFLVAAAQPAGRLHDGIPRLHVIKNFPLPDTAAVELEVQDETDPGDLAEAMAGKLFEGGESPLLRLKVVGSVQQLTAVIWLAIENLHFGYEREISFKPVFTVHTTEDARQRSSMEVLVAAT